VQEPESPDVTESNVEGVEAPVVTSAISIQAAGRARADAETIVADAFELHAGRLTAFARNAVRDVDAADDLVQDTFLRFVNEVRSGRVPDNIGGWLFRVCGNLIVSRGRRRSVADRMKAFLVDRRVAPSPEDQVVRTDENARLKLALEELPPDARVALLMAAEGYSSAEIGASIGRTANATLTYVCRARIRLRELLAEPAQERAP
jgi:RNA polymerase sigma-70 factor (ECF subfamily)